MLRRAEMTETRTLFLTWMMLAIAAWCGASAVWTLIFAETGIPTFNEELRPLAPLERKIAEAPRKFAFLLRREVQAGPYDCVKSPLPPGARLLGTMIEEYNERSSAMLMIAGELRMMKLGEKQDGFELRAIERGSVTLADACNQHTITFDERAPPGFGLPLSGAPWPAPTDLGPVVVKVKETLANMEELGRQVRIVPHARDGAMLFRLLAIRPGSIFDRAGLKNGDLVESVDGRPIAELAGFGALDALVQKGAVTLQFERNGKKLKLPVQLE